METLTKNNNLKTYSYLVISFLLIIVSLLVFNWHVGNIKERENLKRDGVKISALVVTRTE